MVNRHCRALWPDNYEDIVADLSCDAILSSVSFSVDSNEPPRLSIHPSIHPFISISPPSWQPHKDTPLHMSLTQKKLNEKIRKSILLHVRLPSSSSSSIVRILRTRNHFPIRQTSMYPKDSGRPRPQWGRETGSRQPSAGHPTTNHSISRGLFRVLSPRPTFSALTHFNFIYCCSKAPLFLYSPSVSLSLVY